MLHSNRSLTRLDQLIRETQQINLWFVLAAHRLRRELAHHCIGFAAKPGEQKC